MARAGKKLRFVRLLTLSLRSGDSTSCDARVGQVTTALEPLGARGIQSDQRHLQTAART